MLFIPHLYGVVVARYSSAGNKDLGADRMT